MAIAFKSDVALYLIETIRDAGIRQRENQITTAVNFTRSGSLKVKKINGKINPTAIEIMDATALVFHVTPGSAGIIYSCRKLAPHGFLSDKL